MAIYNPGWAVAALVHVICGMLWLGVIFAINATVVPDLQKAQRPADLAGFRNHAPRLSKFGLIIGLATVVTGLIFLFLKFGTDGARLTSDPEPRTVLIALWIAIAALVFGAFVTRPAAMAFGKAASVLPREEPLPEATKAQIAKLVKLVRFQGLLVFLPLIFMVLAVQGGI